MLNNEERNRKIRTCERNWADRTNPNREGPVGLGFSAEQKVGEDVDALLYVSRNPKTFAPEMTIVPFAYRECVDWDKGEMGFEAQKDLKVEAQNNKKN